MKMNLKILTIGLACALMFFLDLAPLPTVSDAEAQYGSRNRVRRRSSRRTAVVVGSSVHAADQAQAQQQQAAAQQQTAAAQQQAAAAEAEAEAAKQQAAAAEAEAAAYKQQAAAAGPLPIGSVVTTLPPGCTTTAAGGVEYHVCGQNYYRTAFQGSQLVYVTTEKP